MGWRSRGPASSPSYPYGAGRESFSLQGHLAATFEIGYSSHPIVQFVFLFVSQANRRLWSAILTGPTFGQLVLNATFAAIIFGFRLTLTTGPSPSYLMIAALGGVAAGAAAAVVLVLLVHRRRKGLPPRAASVTCASCGDSLEPGAKFCGHCGAPAVQGPPPGPGGP